MFSWSEQAPPVTSPTGPFCSLELHLASGNTPTGQSTLGFCRWLSPYLPSQPPFSGLNRQPAFFQGVSKPGGTGAKPGLLGDAKAGAQAPGPKRQSIEPHRLQPKVKTDGSNAGVSPDTSPRNRHPPPPRPRSGPRQAQGASRSQGVPWPEPGGWRLGEGARSSVQASSPRSPQRNTSILLGVSRPLRELPQPTPSPPHSRRAAPRRASPGPRISPPRPAALTCEPRPGPSIVPVTRRDSAKRRRQPAGRRASSLPYPTSCSRPRLRRSSGSRLYPSVGLGRANPCSPLAWGAGLFLPSGRLLGEPRAGGPAPSPAVKFQPPVKTAF